ncbi:MAG: MerR family transcriptional regulator [Clostridia bacterium]|nr:MerR family transcriptional regulator [Clostridia bacterium]
MQIAEVSQKYGLTKDTLRYYEKEGLIGPIKKGENGIRNYEENDLKRIEFVKCMRGAGVEITFLKRYMQLYDEGDNTVEERRNILLEQRRILKEKLDSMQEAYQKLNYKIDLYDKQLLEKDI